MKKKYYILLILISNWATAQTPDSLFYKGNAFYKQGNYNQAISFYKQIEKTGNISDALYYNLGNCYYKLNKVAPTIYNYEKALKINPLNEDAQNNLMFAKRLTLDRVEEVPKTVFQKINQNYLQKLTYNHWAWVCVILSILGATLFLLFYFSEVPNRKRLYFVLSVVVFFLLIGSLTITFSQYNNYKNNIKAIIFSEKVTVKNAPTFNADDVFILHEGTKVTVLDMVDSWKKIKLADGKIGWISANKLKEL